LDFLISCLPACTCMLKHTTPDPASDIT